MLTRCLITLFRVVVMFQSLHTFTRAQDSGDRYKKVATSMLQTTFQTETAVSRIACCASCSDSSKCESVNYKSSSQECQLSSVLFIQLTNNIVPSAEWNVYSKIGDKPRDCQDVQESGIKSTGVYTISPKSGSSFEVRCDMEIAGGGWTVIQRRVSDSDFYKTWDEYKDGFIDYLGDNFWLGNDNIHTVTDSGSYSLRVDLTAQDGETGYATYSSFLIGNEADKYRLSVHGYSGNIGDSLNLHNGMSFTTKDRDNDGYGTNCAVVYSGAWWYRTCHHSNLNGIYGSSEFGKGLNWFTWKGHRESMTRTQLAIKRV